MKVKPRSRGVVIYLSDTEASALTTLISEGEGLLLDGPHSGHWKDGHQYNAGARICQHLPDLILVAQND